MLLHLNEIHLNELVPYQNSSLLLESVSHALNFENIKAKQVSLTICDDAYIQNLNKTYRHKDQPTDVLSFPLGEDDLLGDIFISLPAAINNAQLYNNNDLSREMCVLAIHGTLHLLGYDHVVDSDATIMESKERQILETIAAVTEQANDT